MKPAAFAYTRAQSVDQVLELLSEHGDEARVLAGGQSLVPLMNMRRLRPRMVIDITRVAGLSEVEASDGMLRVGALVTQFALGERGDIDDALADCLPYTGHYVTRHRGTIGGSIAYGEPRGELPLALVTLGGSISVRSRRGEREIPAEQLYTGAFQTSLSADELIVETRWPRAQYGEGRAFAELAQRHGDFTLASAACRLQVRDGRIAWARVGVGAVADRPLLLAEAADALRGEEADERAAACAGEAIRESVDGYDDLHASARYRRQLAGVLATKAVQRALERVDG